MSNPTQSRPLLEEMLSSVQMPSAALRVKHVVLDGKFGNYPATWTLRLSGLHIISKMRHDAALYLPYSGAKPLRGPTPRYGNKIDSAQMPPDSHVSTQIEDDYRIDT